jgi:predicted Zn-dependent protease
MSPAEEVRFGREAVSHVLQQYGGEIDDRALAAYVDDVGHHVAQGVGPEAPNYPYRFHVLRDPRTVNAFALPGGQIFITLGLLTRLHNEAELAGVLGHEVGHVVGRHGSEQLAKQQLTGVLAGAATLAASHDGASQQRAHLVAQAASSLLNLQYSRSDELEADKLGVRFLKAEHYDAHALIAVMQLLQQVSAGSSQPEFMSTHPSPANRIEELQKLVGNEGGELGDVAFRQHVQVAPLAPRPLRR